MNYEDYKARRITITPPMPLKEKIQKYAKGNDAGFIVDAVKEKIAAIEAQNKKDNSIKTILG